MARKSGADGANAGGGRPRAPFGTVEEFLFAVLTLRSNASYREDVALLVRYEAEPEPDNDWVRFDLDKPAFQAARRLIGTWDLICATAAKHSTKDQAFFMGSSPVGFMYGWLKPAIQKIANETNYGDKYAPSFRDFGGRACYQLVNSNPVVFQAKNLLAPDLSLKPDLTLKQQKEFYKTAEELTRPLTHFG